MPLKIGVIGGGAAGLAVLKTLNDTDEIKNGDWIVTAFEKRDDIGGIWYPSPPLDNPPDTPLYDALTTNIPNISMAYRTFPFKPSTPLYPSAEVVLKYLRDYADHFDIRKFIQLRSMVEKCEWNEKDRIWTVRVVKRLEPPASQKTITHEFHKLIIANGHYSIPRYPSIPGLLDWLHPPSTQTEPRATHSIYFRNPAPYKGKRILVVGGGPSGRDIATEMCNVASVVYHSSTGAVPSSTTIGGCTLINRGRLKAFHKDGTVSFADAEEDKPSMVLDHAILATGYEVDFPFIKSPILEKGGVPSFESDPISSKLVNTTYSIYPLTRHILPLTQPTDELKGLPWCADVSSLAFIGLFIRVAPFPLFEAQARYLVSLYRNPTMFSFPLEKRWVEDRYSCLKEKFGTPSLIAKNMHVFAEGVDQYVYGTELLELAGVPKDSELYPEPWNLEVYEAKDMLRHIWRMLEREGKAEEIVRGVGSAPGRAGREEWAEFARMLIREYGSKVVNR